MNDGTFNFPAANVSAAGNAFAAAGANGEVTVETWDNLKSTGSGASVESHGPRLTGAVGAQTMTATAAWVYPGASRIAAKCSLSVATYLELGGLANNPTASGNVGTATANASVSGGPVD